MEVCFNCKVPETRAVLKDSILPEGVVKICNECLKLKEIPKIHGSSEAKKPEKNESVYERLVKISGVDLKKPDPEKEKQDASLKRLIDDNFERDIRDFRKDEDSKRSFIDNFHWIVFRKRREKGLTQDYVADKIRIPKKALKMIEEGYVPKDRGIIDRLENFLGINIRKSSIEKKPQEAGEKIFSKEDEFHISDLDRLTISDLQELKRKREEGLL